jgi:hypothetical protein
MGCYNKQTLDFGLFCLGGVEDQKKLWTYTQLGRNLQLNGEFHELVQTQMGGRSHKKLNALDYIKLTHTHKHQCKSAIIYLFIINLAQMKNIIVKERRK